jgi:hypothetical protein
MRKAICWVLWMSLVGFAWGQQASSNPGTVPAVIRFSGNLVDVNGKPLSGVVGVTFSLYRDEQGGTPLWVETQNVSADKGGHYAVTLGSARTQGLPQAIFASGEARWLGVQPQGQAERARVLLMSVPYALKAADAETVGGLPPSAFVLAAPSTRASTLVTAGSPPVGGSGTTNYIPIWTDNTGDLGNSVLYQTSTGMIGIGTTTPAFTLDVGTGDVSIDSGNLDLPQTSSATNGVITLGGVPFISACCSSTSFNTYVGTGAGNANTQSGYNTAVGYQALTNNTANTNTAIGTSALTANTTGNSNTAVGTSSLQVNTTGGSNTAVGAGALESNGLGLWNTALGSGAGHSNTTGSNNTFVGQAADASTQTLTNATAIGSAAIVGESNALVLGAPGVNVGIGTATPAYALDVHGTGNFTGAVAFSSSQTFPNTISGVTTAAGSGLTGGGTTGTLNLSLLNTCSSSQVLSWSGSAWVCTTIGGGTITGVTAGTDLTGGGTNGNVTLNVDTTKVPQLNASNHFGASQIISGNLSVTGAGAHITARTVSASQSVNTNGSYLLDGGTFLLGSFSKGNAFLGFSGNSTTTGTANTGSGFQALQHNTNGINNTAIGADALFFNSAGLNNTAVGYEALFDNTSGGDLTCIGYKCTAANGLKNATAIGAHAVVGASNALVLGGTGEYAVKVGIGTTTPTSVLTIAKGAGHPVSDGWETFSSRRWKTNIHTLDGALAKVEQLRGVSYDLKDSGRHEVGMIAEEVGEVVPEVVSYEANGTDARGVDYSRLTALLIEATKEQQRELRNQQAELAQALRQIKQQQSLLRAQAAALHSLKAEVRENRETLRKVEAPVATTQPALVAVR